MGHSKVPRASGVRSDARNRVIAIGLLFPAEIAGVVWVRGLSLQEYLASLTKAPDVISLVMFVLFGAMPSLVTLVVKN